MEVAELTPPSLSGRILQERSVAGFQIVERVYDRDTYALTLAHEHAYLAITLQGSWEFQAQGRTLRCKPWTVVYCPPGEVHSIASPVTAASCLHIEISPEFLAQLKEYRGADELLFCAEGRACWVAGQIFPEFRSGESSSDLVLEGLILQLCAEVLRTPVQESEPRPAWVRQADRLICERFREPITLADIAAQVGVHPVHLSREYRRHYHMTIGERIRSLRVEFACQQIATTEAPLVEIALACGFSDQSHFTVTFRNYCGASPSAYRRAIRNC